MGTLSYLSYGGIACLIVLLLIFEFRDGLMGLGGTPRYSGYEYYTASGEGLRIRHVFGSLYKVYVTGECPVPTKRDRYGTYFTVRAHSASEAEYAIDSLYHGGG